MYRFFISAVFRLGSLLEKWVDANRTLQHSLVSLQCRRNAKINKEINSKHLGRRAFVIGCGPSLAAMDITLLRNEITFAVNSFYRHAEIRSWHPTYYCINDPNFFTVNGGTGHSNYMLREITELSLNSIFLLSSIAEESVKLGEIKAEKIYFMNFFGDAKHGVVRWPRFDEALPASLNIAQSAILYAMAAGCNPIYLIGCDHTYRTDGSWSHFHADKHVEREFGGKGYSEKFHGYIYSLMKGYRMIDDFATEHGVRIYNASATSAIDVFEKVCFEELF